MGNPRYLNKELNGPPVRFREYASELALLEPLQTFECSAVAEEMTGQLLHDHPDLVGF